MAAPGSLLRAFTNKGISADANVNAANFDGGGWSYSADALAAQDVTPGSTVTAGDITYTWPAVTTRHPGQRGHGRPTGGGERDGGARQFGFLGSASGGASQGLITLTYTDRSTATVLARAVRLDARRRHAAGRYGNRRRHHDVPQLQPLPRRAGHGEHPPVLGGGAGRPRQDARSVTLPSGTTGGDLHVFAIGTSTAALAGPVVTRSTRARRPRVTP